jgi:hypothetical protein
MEQKEGTLNPVTPPPAERLKIHLIKAFNTFLNPLTFNPNKYYSVTALQSKEPLWGKHVDLTRVAQGLQEQGTDVLTDKAKLYNMLGAVGAKSIGFGGVAALAQLAMRKKKKKKREDLHNYLNAAFPIVELDESTRDPKREDRVEALGIHGTPGLEEWQKESADLSAEIDALAQRGAALRQQKEATVKVAGIDAPGVRDGSGPWRGSAMRSISEVGRRRLVGEVCPVEDKKKDKKKDSDDKGDEEQAQGGAALRQQKEADNLDQEIDALAQRSLYRPPTGPAERFRDPETTATEVPGAGDPLISWAAETLDKAKLVNVPWHPALQLVVPIAVAYAMFKKTDKAADKVELMQLRQTNARKRNILKSMVSKEYQQTRQKPAGQTKTAESKAEGVDRIKEWLSRFTSGSEGSRKEGPITSVGMRVGRTPFHALGTGLPVLYSLWTIASMALAFNYMKRRTDKSDEQRKRAKVLDRFMRHRAVMTAQPPTFVGEEGVWGLPETEEEVTGEDAKPKRKPKLTPKTVTFKQEPPKLTPPEPAPPVDAEDPYAALLGG